MAWFLLLCLRRLSGPDQTSKSYITGVETSDITGLTVCGSVISNPVFLCIFTLHADNNWLENEMNRYQSTL